MTDFIHTGIKKRNNQEEEEKKDSEIINNYVQADADSELAD